MASIGKQLQEAREALRLTIQDVSHQTRVQPNFLRGMEADDWSSFPSVAYARSFLRTYSSFLELDLSSAFAELDEATASSLGDRALVREIKNTLKRDRRLQLEAGGKTYRARLGKKKSSPLMLNFAVFVLVMALVAFYLMGYRNQTYLQTAVGLPPIVEPKPAGKAPAPAPVGEAAMAATIATNTISPPFIPLKAEPALVARPLEEAIVKPPFEVQLTDTLLGEVDQNTPVSGPVPLERRDQIEVFLGQEALAPSAAELSMPAPAALPKEEETWLLPVGSGLVPPKAKVSAGSDPAPEAVEQPSPSDTVRTVPVAALR
jgi:transcriptional regulator with XRE-family HTH domain